MRSLRMGTCVRACMPSGLRAWIFARARARVCVCVTSTRTRTREREGSPILFLEVVPETVAAGLIAQHDAVADVEIGRAVGIVPSELLEKPERPREGEEGQGVCVCMRVCVCVCVWACLPGCVWVGGCRQHT